MNFKERRLRRKKINKLKKQKKMQNKAIEEKKKKSISVKYKPMRLGLDKIMHNVIKIIITLMLFWILYSPMYQMQEDFSLLEELSMTILYLSVSSIMAMLISYIFIIIITNKLHKTRKPFTEYNRITKTSDILYEIIVITISSLMYAGGLFFYMIEFTETWEQFFLSIAIIQLISRIFAFGIAKAIENNILIIVMILTSFLLINIFAIITLMGQSLLGKSEL